MKNIIREKHIWWKGLLLAAVVLGMLPFIQLKPAQAATETVSIQVTYGQTQARNLADMINAKRRAVAQASSASAINLAYDYGLEKTAMKRAAEIALNYAKDTSKSECLYALESDPSMVCDAWTATAGSNEYTLLVKDGSYRAIGIGHVTYQNQDYWVAEVATSSTSTPAIGAQNGAATVNVTLESSLITSRTLSITPPATLSMNVGDTYSLGNCKATIGVNGHMPAGECQLAGTVNVVSDNTSVVSCNGTSLVAQAAGTANITLSCAGLTSGTMRVTVTQPSIANATIAAIPDQNYTGYAITPSVTVTLGGSTLVLNRDYTVSYANNINVGMAVVTVNGTGNYAGQSKSTTFRIVTPSVANATISAIPDQTYTGYAICPTLTVYSNNGGLRENTDYTVSYTNNINIGTASVTITGIGGYTGTKTATFRITGPNLSAATIAAIPDQLYTGSDIRPSLTVTVNNVTLIQNVDYNVSYSNNRREGTATVTITGKGNYTGTKTTTFRIIAKNISNTTVSSIDTQRYTGKDVCPSVTVQIGSTVLVRNVDYTLTYRDNRSPGTASITINGAGAYTGSKTVTFKIAQPSLSSATVKISATPTYNGEEKLPRVTVKLYGETLEEDEDYELDYRNNIKPGKATVVIYGLGDYSGSKKANFVILPGKPGWISVKAKGNAAVLSWKRDRYVAGYEVYRSRQAATGYSRLGSLNKNTNTKCQNINLSKGTYYYKIRSYIQADGRKYYSAYSKAKKVTIRS